MKSTWLFVGVMMLVIGCSSDKKSTGMPQSKQNASIQLITVDPGHFHAALVQKTMYEDIDPEVQIYAPEGNDLVLHLERIDAFNRREDDPTAWQSKVYTGADFFEKMIAARAGNVVVLSGNNRNKTEYILEAVKAGYHVYADKPMAINTQDFELLKEAFRLADEKGLLLYDIMTERFEITAMLQRELARKEEVFGRLTPGTADQPAVVKESVHHFYKQVSGKPLVRPAWFFDVDQEGDGMVDVGTHLVDLIQWTCFPDEIITPDSIAIASARRWPTEISISQFQQVTRQTSFPEYLSPVVEDSVLQVYSNGEFTYQINGVFARVGVIWNFEAPEGGGDTHYSEMTGTLAKLVVRQDEAGDFLPVLWLEPRSPQFSEAAAFAAVQALQKNYAGIRLRKDGDRYVIEIPDELREGHEAHFASVTRNFIRYFNHKDLPEWEVPGMIAKYYTTTQALEAAMK